MFKKSPIDEVIDLHIKNAMTDKMSVEKSDQLLGSLKVDDEN